MSSFEQLFMFVSVINCSLHVFSFRLLIEEKQIEKALTLAEDGGGRSWGPLLARLVVALGEHLRATKNNAKLHPTPTLN